MRWLLVGLVAAIGGMAVWRRKTLKDDVEQISTATRDAARQVSDKVQSNGTVSDAADFVEDAAESAVEAADDTAEAAKEAAGD